MIHRIAAPLSLAVLAAAGALVVLAFYWLLFDANPPIVFTPNVMPVERAVFRAGDEVYITSRFCLFTDVNSKRDRILVGIPQSYVLLANAPGTGQPRGCQALRFRLFVVTADMAPGEYYVLHTNRYQVNPLAEREVSWRTTTFRIER